MKSRTEHFSIFRPLCKESLVLKMQTLSPKNPETHVTASLVALRLHTTVAGCFTIFSLPFTMCNVSSKQFFLFIAFPSSFDQYRYESRRISHHWLQRAGSLLLTAILSGALRLPLAKSFEPFFSTMVKAEDCGCLHPKGSHPWIGRVSGSKRGL